MSAKERAFSQIQRWIIDGTLQPGEKLLMLKWLNRLESAGLQFGRHFSYSNSKVVSMHPGKETKVTNIEKNDIFKMYSTMAALQALAAEITAQIIVPEQIEKTKIHKFGICKFY